jgi:hypothetical protein
MTAPVDPDQTLALPHDGTRPLQRMLRWVVDQPTEAA